MQEDYSRFYPLTGGFSPSYASSRSDSAVDCNTAPHTPEIPSRRPYASFHQCPWPQCASSPFADFPALLRHGKETHAMFRAEAPHNYEGSEEVKLRGVYYPSQAQGLFRNPPSHPHPLERFVGTYFEQQMPTSFSQPSHARATTPRQPEYYRDATEAMYPCLYPKCERSFPQTTLLLGHVLLDHAQTMWGQPESSTASFQQEAFFADLSREYGRLLFHNAQNSDKPYGLSGGEEYWRSRHAPPGSGNSRYGQWPMDMPIPESLRDPSALPLNYQAWFSVSSQLDPESMLPQFIPHPTLGGKRKSASIEDRLSRDPSCDSGIFLDRQRKERKLAHHRDLYEFESEKEEDEVRGGSALTPEPQHPYLKGVSLEDESFVPQSQRMSVAYMRPCDNLPESHEPSEFRRHSLESPTSLFEGPAKPHKPCGFRRHSLESQNMGFPPAEHIDGRGPSDISDEWRVQPEVPNDVPQKLPCQETRDLLQKPSHGDSIHQANISSGKEMTSPKKAPPQPYSHQQLSMWKELLPTIQRDYAEIMGADNNGSIQLLNKNGRGIVAVTCQFPKRVRNKILKKKLGCLGLDFEVHKGSIRRSDQLGNYEWPAIYGHHTVQPSCGASLGVSRDEKLESSVSLGGYIKLRKQGHQRWQWYATTSHHLLEAGIDTESDCNDDGDDDDHNYYNDDRSEHEDDEHMDSDESDEGDDGEPEPANSEFLTKGVRDGTICLGSEPPRTFEIQSPSKVYHDSALGRLKGRKQFVKDYPGHQDLEDPIQLDDAIRDLEKADTFFGKAHESSGLCISGNKQMDWLLIGDIPRERIGSNDSRDWSSFMEGISRGSRSQSSSRSTFVNEDKFNNLISAINRYYASHADKYCPYSRIHGSGCESGLSDGQLLVPPVVVQLNNMAPTTEWTFKPRRKNGLGTFGDSGTWLYTACGELLGQVLGYDPKNDVAFYTPIYLVFDHMKKRIGAEDIQLPTREDYRQQQFVKPFAIPSTPRKSSTLAARNTLLTPPEDVGDRIEGPTPHPLVCLASEGVCCSHSFDRSLAPSPPVWRPDSR